VKGYWGIFVCFAEPGVAAGERVFENYGSQKWLQKKILTSTAKGAIINWLLWRRSHDN
jgi:hypothetical protein